MWFKVDDQLHDHRKSRLAGKAAMGVWVLAGSWCGSSLTDGFVPASVLARWGTKADAARLVTAGYWEPSERDGEPGWQFHDWLDYQPDRRTLQLKEAASSEAGTRAAHIRWHKRRRIKDPECTHCQDEAAS